MKHIENNKNVDPIKHALYGQLNILSKTSWLSLGRDLNTLDKSLSRRLISTSSEFLKLFDFYVIKFKIIIKICNI